MKTKEWVIFGLIIGIALFFLGAMISSIFYQPNTSEEVKDYTVDKVSKSIKLIGLGILTTTLIVGGIVGHDLHKHFKLIILIIGLVLLLVFSIGAQFMKWDDTPSYYYGNSQGAFEAPSSEYGEEYASSRPPSTPGFELVVAIGAIATVFAFRRIKRKT